MPHSPLHGRHRADRPGSHAASAPRRRWPWITAASVVGVVGVLGAFTAVFAVQAVSVKDDLMAAKSQISSIAKYVKSGDSAKISVAGDKILSLTGRANDSVQGPLWEIAAGLPLVGQNVDAVRRATEATDILAKGAMPAGVKMLSALRIDKVSVKGGGVNLEPVEEASASLPEIKTAFAQAQAKLDGVDRAKLLPVVDNAVGSLFDVIDQAGPALEQVEHYLPTFLKVAGVDGKRSYLLVFQNNAESRAGGGLPAATALVNVDDGHVKLAEQTGTSSFSHRAPQFAIPAETQALYESDTFTWFGNYTRTPDFPTTAKLFDGLWSQTFNGQHLDGVITLDPVVLSHMLKVTGPIKTADGRELTSENVVEALLYDAYVRYPVSQQDAFFADVAARVFAKLSSGNWDVTKMLGALDTSVKEQRLHAWFPREDEQAMAVELGLEGALSTNNDKATQVGIYINDAAYSKLEYFMKTKVQVTCDPAAGTMSTALTIYNSAQLGEMSNYQQGIRNKRYGVPRNTFIQDVMYFAPPGSTITGVDTQNSDSPYDARTGSEKGHNVQSVRMLVPGGESRTVTYTSTIPKGAHGPLEVRSSPTVTKTPISVSPTCESVFPAS